MIQIENLNTAYKSKIILKDINCTFVDGNITCILGKNGSGKSTLLKSILGTVKPISGTIKLDEVEIQKYSHKDRAKNISLVMQSRSSVGVKAIDMVLYGRFPYTDAMGKYKKQDEEIALKCLEKMDILHLKDKNVDQLSGGERQKVYIAMLLAQDTQNVLMDEPTTYLDISQQTFLWETAKKMSKQNKCVVIVSHDISQAFNYADCICIVDDGSILAIDKPREILKTNIITEVFGVNHIVAENRVFFY